tara:strand:- start:263 stop:475 length:213 start_codon:yes stop_codon:yes gene_type:complete
MSNQYQIGETVTFKTKIFGTEKILTNTIYDINIEDNKILYLIHGLGQQLLERCLSGEEDCFVVNENNIIK